MRIFSYDEFICFGKMGIISTGRISVGTGLKFYFVISSRRKSVKKNI